MARVDGGTEVPPDDTRAVADSGNGVGRDFSPAIQWSIYMSIALSGLTAMSAEVIWTRFLALSFGATVYTFSLILAAILVGLGTGSAIGGLIQTRTRVDPRTALGRCQMLDRSRDYLGQLCLAGCHPVRSAQPVGVERSLGNVPMGFLQSACRRLAGRGVVGCELSARPRVARGEWRKRAPSGLQGLRRKHTRRDCRISRNRSAPREFGRQSPRPATAHPRRRRLWRSRPDGQDSRPHSIFLVGGDRSGPRCSRLQPHTATWPARCLWSPHARLAPNHPSWGHREDYLRGRGRQRIRGRLARRQRRPHLSRGRQSPGVHAPARHAAAAAPGAPLAPPAGTPDRGPGDRLRRRHYGRRARDGTGS